LEYSSSIPKCLHLSLPCFLDSVFLNVHLATPLSLPCFFSSHACYGLVKSLLSSWWVILSWANKQCHYGLVPTAWIVARANRHTASVGCFYLQRLSILCLIPVTHVKRSSLCSTRQPPPLLLGQKPFPLPMSGICLALISSILQWLSRPASQSIKTQNVDIWWPGTPWTALP